MNGERHSRTFDRFSLGFAALLVGALLIEEVPRVLFPWDLRLFSESPFMTGMLKLTQGQPVHTSYADASSYTYAPGLEYLTYALLRPFGLQLDVRFCRAVSVVIGLTSAFVAGSVIERATRCLGGGPSRTRRAIATSLAALVIFKNYTADACHPDNLYGLHVVTLVALTFWAAEKVSWRRALVALAFAALGIAVKQTAAAGVIGSAGALVFCCGRAWGRRTSVMLAAFGIGCAAVMSHLVLRGWTGSWTVALLSRQAIELTRYHQLVSFYVTVPYRLVLAVSLPPCAIYAALRANDGPLRRLFVAWLAIGVTEAVPSLVSFFKHGGYWNNLVVVDLWASLIVVAVLFHAIEEARARGSIAARAASYGALVILLSSLVPTRIPPTHRQYAFGRALDAAIARDVASGKSVLLSQGVASLVRNGLLTVPLDRAASSIELDAGGVSDFAATKERLASGTYDRIYVLDGYPRAIQETIDAHYHAVEVIPGDTEWHRDDDLFAYLGQFDGAHVYESNRR